LKPGKKFEGLPTFAGGKTIQKDYGSTVGELTMSLAQSSSSINHEIVDGEFDDEQNQRASTEDAKDFEEIEDNSTKSKTVKLKKSGTQSMF